jgi:hypothetical protein
MLYVDFVIYAAKRINRENNRVATLLPSVRIKIMACLAFTGQTTDGISTNLYRSDQFYPYVCKSRHVPLCCTKWLSQLKIEKYCPHFTGQTTGGI